MFILRIEKLQGHEIKTMSMVFEVFYSVLVRSNVCLSRSDPALSQPSRAKSAMKSRSSHAESLTGVIDAASGQNSQSAITASSIDLLCDEPIYAYALLHVMFASRRYYGDADDTAHNVHAVQSARQTVAHEGPVTSVM